MGEIEEDLRLTFGDADAPDTGLKPWLAGEIGRMQWRSFFWGFVTFLIANYILELIGGLS